MGLTDNASFLKEHGRSQVQREQARSYNRQLTKNPLTVTGSAGFLYCGSAKSGIPPQRQNNWITKPYQPQHFPSVLSVLLPEQ
jgi:hypothetical protein